MQGILIVLVSLVLFSVQMTNTFLIIIIVKGYFLSFVELGFYRRLIRKVYPMGTSFSSKLGGALLSPPPLYLSRLASIRT